MKIIISLLFVLLDVLTTLAYNPFSFVKYQVENGLSHNTIWSVMQDKQGFMWFGTGDGLNRFDGKNFKIFRHIPQDTNSLGNNNVRCLAEDRDQNLWVGTTRGIYLLDPRTETFAYFGHKTEDGVSISSNVYSIYPAPNGLIWIATFGQGLFIYNPQNDILTQNTQYSSFIKYLAPTPSGDLYVGTKQEGIICLDSNGSFKQSYIPETHFSDQNIEINALYYHNDTLWFSAGTSTLNLIDLETRHFESYRPQQSNFNVTNIRSILSYSDTELMIGADNGLYLFEIPTRRYTRLDDPSNPHSLSDQSIYHIYKDREGGTWIATNLGGVNYLPQNLKLFESYFPRYQSGSLSGKAISEFCEDAQGNIWIATEDGGINYLNTETNDIKTYLPNKQGSSISYHNIHALFLDGHQLWIGTFSRGLDLLDLRTGKVRNFQHNRDNIKTISDNNIYSIYKDHRGDLYIGTAWGLNVYDPRTGTFSLVAEVGSTSHIYDIREDSRNNLWIATYNAGLFRYHYSNGKWTHYNYNPDRPGSISSNSIITIFEDSRHTLWFGTEGAGLCSFDYETETFIPFDPENKLLPNPVIYAIEEDKSGNLWIAGNAGLLCVHPQSRKWKLYTQADGLQSNQFNFHSSLHARDDKLYFGGINGFNAFYPENFKDNTYIPEIAITRFSLFNQDISPNSPDSPLEQSITKTRKIILNHDQNTFGFAFASLSYQAPGKNQYAYILEGGDKEWIYADNKNEASYTNLQPGEYTFRVKGSNNDGIWNDNGPFIRITILPPFWKSNLAYGLYLVILISVIGFLLRLWSQRVKKKHGEILKEYRLQQEKETYQSKINFFTQVAHEIRTPLSLIKMPLESILQSGDGNDRTRKYLSTMNKNTDRLLDLINQLLDFRKTEANELKLKFRKQDITELLQNIIGRFAPTIQLKNLHFTVRFPENPYIACVDKEAFTKIVSNLMSNALKYAKDEICLELKGEADYFEIRVGDNGPGIPRANRKRIFEVFYQSDNSRSGTGIGLPLARLLTEKHSGRLYLDETIDEGSCFIIHIPRLEENAAETETLDEEILTATLAPTDVIVEVPEGAGKYKILITEDNIELLNLTAEQLSEHFQIVTATDGVEALEILKNENIDLIVSDVMMPEMDGYTLCGKVKNDPQYSHIPFILLTAKTTTDDKIQGLNSGSDAYLEKPFSIYHLKSQIDNLLQSRQKLRQLFASSPLAAPEIMAISPKDKEFIERLDSEIQKNIQEPTFSIDTLAEIMCMSRSNFYRKIKGISGMSPNDYLKTIRLKMAAELLLRQEFRINEIYEQVGFSSSSYFTKCFKEQFGVPPKEFLNNARNNAANI